LDRVIRIPRCNFPRVLNVRWSALNEVRRNRFDCCVNLHGGSTGAWFTLLSGARFRVGLEGFRNRFAYNVLSLVPPRKSDGSKMHSVEYQIHWLRQLGLPESPIPALKVAADLRAKLRVMDRLISAGLSADLPYAVIQPASKFHTKEWTPEGFAEIVKYLSQSYRLQSVVIGGPGEAPQVEAVAKRCETRAIVLSGISVAELMGVIQGATIFIGNDSGPTHIASALRVPVVVIFGSSDSKVWFPWQASSRVVQNDFACNPCPGYRCLVYHEPRCILSITPSQVKAAIDSLLQGRLKDLPLRS